MSCAAQGCTNRTVAGFRTFRFPLEKQRRKVWIHNCRQKDWAPTTSSRLCEVHFEDSQWECNRDDGWRKLKWNVVTTIFSVPNPPKVLDYKQKSVYKIRPDAEKCNDFNQNTFHFSFTSEKLAKLNSISKMSEGYQSNHTAVPSASVNCPAKQMSVITSHPKPSKAYQNINTERPVSSSILPVSHLEPSETDRNTNTDVPGRSR